MGTKIDDLIEHFSLLSDNQEYRAALERCRPDHPLHSPWAWQAALSHAKHCLDELALYDFIFVMEGKYEKTCC